MLELTITAASHADMIRLLKDMLSGGTTEQPQTPAYVEPDVWRPAPTEEPADPTPAAVFAATNTPAPPVPTMGIVLDIQGLPWDARIHASTKTKTVDGKWKLKRGVTDVEVAKVQAELLQALGGAPAPAAVPPAPPAPAAVPPAPPAPAATPSIELFTQKIMEGYANGSLKNDALQAAFIKCGLVGGLPAVRLRPDLIPAIAAEVGITL